MKPMNRLPRHKETGKRIRWQQECGTITSIENVTGSFTRHILDKES